MRTLILTRSPVPMAAYAAGHSPNARRKATQHQSSPNGRFGTRDKIHVSTRRKAGSTRDTRYAPCESWPWREKYKKEALMWLAAMSDQNEACADLLRLYHRKARRDDLGCSITCRAEGRSAPACTVYMGQGWWQQAY